MRFLTSSDWHLSDDPRDAYRFHIIEDNIPALIKKQGVTALLYLGDICEAKDEHPAELVNRVTALFHELSALCPVIINQGNHDWLSGPDNPYFRFLNRLPNIAWVNEPESIERIFWLRWKQRVNIKAIMLPYTANYERDWGDIDFKAYDWAFAHQTFTNAKSDSGFRLSGVPLSYFPKNLNVVSGDIHSPQTLGPLTYVGSPFHVDFGDNYKPRVLLLENDRLRSIPIQGAQKRLVEIKAGGRLPLKELSKGDILKVRVTLNTEQQANWPEFARSIREEALTAGITVHIVQPLLDSAGGSMNAQRKKVDNRSDEQLLKDYGAARSVDNATLKTGIKLL